MCVYSVGRVTHDTGQPRAVPLDYFCGRRKSWWSLKKREWWVTLSLSRRHVGGGCGDFFSHFFFGFLFHYRRVSCECGKSVRKYAERVAKFGIKVGRKWNASSRSLTFFWQMLICHLDEECNYFKSITISFRYFPFGFSRRIWADGWTLNLGRKLAFQLNFAGFLLLCSVNNFIVYHLYKLLYVCHKVISILLE